MSDAASGRGIDVNILNLVDLANKFGELTALFRSAQGLPAEIPPINWPAVGLVNGTAETYTRALTMLDGAAAAGEDACTTFYQGLAAVARHYAGSELASELEPLPRASEQSDGSPHGSGTNWALTGAGAAILGTGAYNLTHTLRTTPRNEPLYTRFLTSLDKRIIAEYGDKAPWHDPELVKQAQKALELAKGRLRLTFVAPTCLLAITVTLANIRDWSPFDQAESGWRAFASAVGGAHDAVETLLETVRRHWTGATADAFVDHVTHIVLPAFDKLMVFATALADWCAAMSGALANFVQYAAVIAVTFLMAVYLVPLPPWIGPTLAALTFAAAVAALVASLAQIFGAVRAPVGRVSDETEELYRSFLDNNRQIKERSRIEPPFQLVYDWTDDDWKGQWSFA
ncbi:hypothetical protein Misp01_25270 [Microtetraspora sp. NBRC 13810]|uniref:hypothetical protein n=1 Tax=Microtetraspora sp. NBRC 13810 TaxID=3030990 RepID=UPI0024A2673E|nr:hypothetical protein [Microtetraspora sp. NBRC 13810]GLW07397.1 hypothetical protein Misp01_25270 [Microtetraspora sp. NBRC 13810]